MSSKLFFIFLSLSSLLPLKEDLKVSYQVGQVKVMNPNKNTDLLYALCINKLIHVTLPI